MQIESVSDTRNRFSFEQAVKKKIETFQLDISRSNQDRAIDCAHDTLHESVAGHSSDYYI